MLLFKIRFLILYYFLYKFYEETIISVVDLSIFLLNLKLIPINTYYKLMRRNIFLITQI
jgi:hypothetical protein